MPQTASAEKRARQGLLRQARLLPYKTHMRTMMRKLREAAKSGKKADIQKLLPEVYKSIDMAAKKNIIHSKNADRKKSAMAKLAA